MNGIVPLFHHTFSVAGLREWNALPADIRNITDLSFFMRAKKTLFCIGIFGLNSFIFFDCTMFGASGQFVRGGGLAMPYRWVLLITYLFCRKTGPVTNQYPPLSIFLFRTSAKMRSRSAETLFTKFLEIADSRDITLVLQLVT